ncbi:TonB-dependent receptor [bacterium]|nr:TonB-dependent receptor [bacterium]
MRRILFLVFFFLYMSLTGTEKNAIISGNVIDKHGQAIAYANVFIVETMEGTVTDKVGNFHFESKNVGIINLRITYMGYASYEKKIHLQPGKHYQYKVRLEEETVQGKAITITASSYIASNEEGTTLTAMDVIRTPGAAADLFWAIKALPGVQQAAEGAGLFVRGGDVTETAIYLDGALISHPYKYESPTGGFFGSFSPFLLKGTYFSSGGYGAQYGNGLSGVLAMESLDMPAEATYGFGIGLAAESAFISLPVIKGKLGVSVSGNLSNTKMLFKLNGSAERFTRTPQSSDLNINAIARLSKYWQLKLFHFMQSDRVGVRVEDPDNPGVFENDAKNRFTHAVLQGVLPGDWLIIVNGGVSRYSQHPRMAAMNFNMHDDLGQFHINIEKGWGDLHIKAGTEMLDYTTTINGASTRDDDNTDPDADAFIFDTNYQARKFAAYLSIDVPVGAFKFIPGLRSTYDNQADQLVIDPRISIVYGLSMNWTVTAALGQYHQTPNPRYYDEHIGNPDLGYSRARHAIAGVQFDKDGTLFRVEAYVKKYDNLLLHDLGYRYINEGYGYARGIDAFLKSKYKTFSGWLSYSWLDAKRCWMDLPVVVSPYFDITNNFTAVLNWEATVRLNFGASFRAATGRPYTPSADAFQSKRVPPYIKLDLTVGYNTCLFGSDMTILYASCSNVLGRTNIMNYSYSSDYTQRVAVKSAFSRQVYFGFQINF